MEKTRQEVALEIVSEINAAPEQEKELRTLKELELVLIGGGGDDIVIW